MGGGYLAFGYSGREEGDRGDDVVLEGAPLILKPLDWEETLEQRRGERQRGKGREGITTEGGGRGGGGRDRGRFEDAVLLALVMEEKAMSQGLQTSSRIQKRQRNRFTLRVPRRKPALRTAHLRASKP